MRQLTISKSITSRESASLDRYLAEIGKHELISGEEEVLLARRIREGDHSALERLTLANLRFVVSVAKQYQNQGLALIDLINEGNLGLVKAAKRFDEMRGFKFISYAVWWIRQAIMQAIAEQSRVIRLPLNKIGSLNRIRKAKDKLEQALERDPSAQEIASALDISEEEVRVAASISSRHISTDATFGSNDDVSVMDIVYDPENPMPDNTLMSNSLSIEVKRALATLTPRENDVITLFFGIGSPAGLTLEEIGERYGLTRERVRQIKEKGLRRLRVAARSKQLKSYLA
jgi:RNA polymerase primary sigma factor